jgi:hypothetical protein
MGWKLRCVDVQSEVRMYRCEAGNRIYLPEIEAAVKYFQIFFLLLYLRFSSLVCKKRSRPIDVSLIMVVALDSRYCWSAKRNTAVYREPWSTSIEYLEVDM